MLSCVFTEFMSWDIKYNAKLPKGVISYVIWAVRNKKSTINCSFIGEGLFHSCYQIYLLEIVETIHCIAVVSWEGHNIAFSVNTEIQKPQYVKKMFADFCLAGVHFYGIKFSGINGKS